MVNENEMNTFTLTQAQLNQAVEIFLADQWGLKNPVVSDVRTTRPTEGLRTAVVSLTINYKKATNDRSQKAA